MSDSESGKGDNDTTLQDVKEEKKEEQKSSKKDESSAKENNKRTSNKKNKKKEELKHKEDESEESEDEEVGLLDKPLEVTGSRERKKVERLEVSFSTSKEKIEIVKGSGENLGDIPRVEYQIQRASTDDLKVLHRLLFNRPGNANEVRKNIKKFSGFTFAKDSIEHKKIKAKLEKLMITSLKNQCEILDLEKGGTKEGKINRIMEFLIKPQVSFKKVPTPKKRLSKGKGSKKKEKIVKKGGSMKKKSSSSEEDESEEPSEKESDEDKDMDIDEEKVDEDKSDEDVAPPKKKGKAKATPKKKPIEVKSKKEKGVDKTKKADDKKAEAKTSKKRKVISDSDKESSEDEDDVPLAKKSKSPPSDEEIKQLVKKILDDADLEEITMKKVIKQVFDEYPDFDLNEKKDYIKATVKSVIS